MWLTCLRVLENHHDAEDQAQHALERAFRAAATYRGESSVGAWLRTIAENTSRTAARARKARSTTTLPGCEASPRHGLPDLEQVVVTRLTLHEAIAQIPEPYRHTFELVYYHGLSKAEAAAVQRIKPMTVGSRCSRAKRALAKYLYETGNL